MKKSLGKCKHIVKRSLYIITILILTISLTACNFDEFAGQLFENYIFTLWEQGQYETAMARTDQLVSMFPKSITLLNNKAYMMIENEDYDNALIVIDKILESNPDNDVALNNKAWAYNLMERYEDAICVLDYSISAGNESESEYINKANALIGLCNYEDAIFCYDKALSYNPKSLYALYGKGVAYYNQFKYPDAICEFEKYIDLYRNDMSAYSYLGYSYYNNFQYDKALETSEILINVSADNINGYLLKVDCLISMTHYNEALSLMQNIEQNEVFQNDFINIYDRLGEIHYFLTNYNRSVSYYQKAFESTPNSVYYIVQIGYNYLEMYNYDKCEEFIQKAKNIDNTYHDIYNLAGLRYAYQTKYKTALSEFEKALSYKPDYYDAAINKVWVLFLSKQYKKCLDYCYEAILNFDESYDFLLYQGHCHRYLYQLQEAVDIYQIALKLRPNDETVLTALTYTYFDLHDVVLCMEYAEKTLSINPENSTALYLSQLIKGYSGSFAQQVSDFFYDTYLYSDKINGFESICKDFSYLDNATIEDVVEFIYDNKLETDYYTYVITDEEYLEQLYDISANEIIVDNTNNVYLFKFANFSYTIGYEFIEYVNSITNPEESILIVDLRDNGGGLIQGAVDMLDCLLEGYIVCTTVDRNGYTESYRSDADKIKFKKIYIFANGSSASASELFILGMRKYANNVTVIGYPTLGKGVGQIIHIDYSRNIAIVAVNFYWNVKEENINEKPIQPDISGDLLDLPNVPEKDIVINYYNVYR